jgi:hypothetical protein
LIYRCSFTRYDGLASDFIVSGFIAATIDQSVFESRSSLQICHTFRKSSCLMEDPRKS